MGIFFLENSLHVMLHLFTPWCCPELTEATSQQDCPWASGFPAACQFVLAMPPKPERTPCIPDLYSRPLTSASPLPSSPAQSLVKNTK